MYCVYFLAMSAMITGVFIHYGKDNVCSISNYSVVDIGMYMIIFGGTVSCQITFNLVMLNGIVFLEFFPEIFQMIHCFGASVMFLFYVVWCVIGFYIYDQEMPKDCQESTAGKVMISSCIIIFVSGCCGCAPLLSCLEVW